jgi:hypothetical protein
VSCALTCSALSGPCEGRLGARLSLADRRGRKPFGDEPPKCFSATRCHRGTLQVKGHDTVSASQVGPVLRRCSGREVNGRCYQGIHTSGRRPYCVSRTRSGPEPPGYDRGTRTVRVALRWRGSRARTDTTHCPISRHQLQRGNQYIQRQRPWPLISPLSCGNFGPRAYRNGNATGHPDSLSGDAGLREVCYRVKSRCCAGQMIAG